MSKINELEDGVFEIELDKNFDFSCHKDFRQQIKDIVAKNPSTLKMSFKNVEYLDSAALGMLMLAKHEADAIKAPVSITNLKEGHARKVLELVKFDQIFAIEYA